jgi:predicted ferric reductase
MWSFEDPGLSNRFLTANITMASIGKVTGIVGFVLYAVSLVLSVRRRWLENFFDGLNRVYIAHHITGALALAFLAFHPMFLALRYVSVQVPESFRLAAQQLLPRWYDVAGSASDAQDALALDAGIVAFIAMVALLVVTLYIKLPYHIWLWTHRVLGPAFVLAALHTLFLTSDVTRMPVLWWSMVVVSIVGTAAYVYRSLMGNIIVRRAAYKVKDVVHLGGNTVMVELTPINTPVKFAPGQFVFVKFMYAEGSGVSSEVHPFSIASSPYEPGMRLCIKALGDYTKALDKLEPGSIAEIEGAFGHFSYTDFPNKPQVWIGGGIGVTPLLSMARSLTNTSPGVHFFYSVAKPEELFDQALLQDYLPQVLVGKFWYHPFVTSQQPRFLDVSYISQAVGGDLAKYEFFICGPPGMMVALRKQLRAVGVKNSTIHTEEFSMS